MTESNTVGQVLIRPMRAGDVPQAQEVGQLAWSDIASREIGRKVQYPTRPRRIIEAYMWKEPEGCLVADLQGRVVGAAYSHVWGRVGWLGPFEVLPEMQGRGIGRSLLHASETFLLQRGCDVLGLETMCSSTRNIHFYMKGGYQAGGVSLIMERALTSKDEGESDLEAASVDEVVGAGSELRALSARGSPSVDYSRELEMSARYDLGPVFLWKKGGRIRGVAAVHSFFPQQESDHASLRLLLVDPKAKGQEEGFVRLMRSCQGWAFKHGRRRMFVRFSAEKDDLYSGMASLGYRLGSVNLRLTRGFSYYERGRYHLAAWAG